MTTTNITFRASTSLMEDYRLGTEITPQTAITQLVNAAGESELFYSGSDGQRGTVIYDVRPDSSTDTGWSVTAVQPDTFPGQITGGASGKAFTLFVVGPDVSNPDIHYAQRDAAGTWGAWRSVDPSSVFQTLVSPVSVRNVACEIVNGSLELLAVLCDAGGNLAIWRVDWSGTLGGWQKLGNVDSPFLDLCTTRWGSGVLGAQRNAASPASMDLMFFSIDGKTTVTVAAQQHFRDADSALQGPDSTGARYSGVFLYNDGATGGSRSVSYIDCSVAAPAPVPIDTTLTCNQIVAVAAGANPITFFALDLHMRLNVISQNPASGKWMPAIELGEELSSITAGLDATGAPAVFAVDARASNLYMMQEQPQSAGGKWTRQEIEAQQRTIEKLAVYGTTFTLMDGDGNTLPHATLHVTSPESTVVSWQGRTFSIGPNVSKTLTTDANGQVTLYAPTGSINAAKLLFSAPDRMANGDAIVVDADDHVRERLQKLTVAETASLLPSQYQQDAAHVQQAVLTAMSYKPPALAGAHRNVRFVAAGQAAERYGRPLDASSGRVQHWRFTLRDGRATYEEITAADAAALREEIRRDAQGDFFDWLGDIVHAVGNAVQSACDYVVTTVGDAIQATIRIVIQGIQYVFDGVIHTIERAFQVAEAILHSVGVFFEKLFDFFAWLLSDARRDIWETKKVFEQLLNDSFPKLTALCRQGEGAAAGFFAGLKRDVAANFDAALRSVGDDTFDYRNAAAALAPAFGTPAGLALTPGDIAQAYLDASVKANWLMEKISSALGAPSFDSSLPQPVLDAFNAFSSRLTAAIGPAILTEISTVGNYLTSVVKNPGNFMKSTIRALLTTAKTLVLTILDVLDALTQAFFELVIAFLGAAKPGIFDRSVGGFFLGALYDLLNPEGKEELTVTRLVAMVCAFPVTIVYRIIEGSAPYSGFAGDELAVRKPDSHRKVGGILTCVWSLGDVALDVGSVDGQRIGPVDLMLGAFVPVMMTIMSSPGPYPFETLPWDSPLHKAKNTFWCTKWAPAGFTAIYSACNKFTAGPRGNPVACGVLAALGGAVLGTGIWKGVEESNAGVATSNTWFANIAGPLVTVAKPAKFIAPPFGTAALVAIDFIGDIGSGAIAIENG